MGTAMPCAQLCTGRSGACCSLCNEGQAESSTWPRLQGGSNHHKAHPIVLSREARTPTSMSVLNNAITRL
jgi:hypothetical protein